MHSSSKFIFTIYADDTSLLLTDTSLNSLHQNLEQELILIISWLESNNLNLNLNKTNYILFQNRSRKYYIPQVIVKGEQVQRVSHTKFLGLHIDENVNWSYHINEVCTKLSKICGVLYRVRDQLTTESLLSIYYTLCYPHLIYCVSIWSSTWPSFLSKIFIAQNKIVRCIMFKKKFDSASCIYPQLNLLNFKFIKTYFVLLLIYKNVNIFPGKKLFTVLDSIRNTRSSNVNLVCPQFHTTSLYKNSVLCNSPQLWNSLPTHLKSLLCTNNVLQFIKKIKSYLYSCQSQS